MVDWHEEDDIEETWSSDAGDNDRVIVDMPERLHFAYILSLVTGVLILAFFLFMGADFNGGRPISGVFKAISLLAPVTAGVFMSFAEDAEFAAFLTLAHVIFLLWSLIRYWKHKPLKVTLPIGINLVWGGCSFFALIIVVAIGSALLVQDLKRGAESREEAKAARILRKAMRD